VAAVPVGPAAAVPRVAAHRAAAALQVEGHSVAAQAEALLQS